MLLTNIQNFIRCHRFSSNALLLFPGSSSGFHITFECHVSLKFLLLVPLPRSFFVFCNFDTLKTTGQSQCRMSPPSGFTWWFLMIRMRLCIIGKGTWELLEHTFRGPWCQYLSLVIDHLVKVLIARIFYCKTIFPFEITEYLGRDPLVSVNILFLAIQVYSQGLCHPFSLSTLLSDTMRCPWLILRGFFFFPCPNLKID